MNKILFLVMVYDNPLLMKEYDIVMHHYYAMKEKFGLNHIEIHGYSSGDKDEYDEEKHLFRFKCSGPESNALTYEKTLKMFKYALNNIEFDYVYRTNTSTLCNLVLLDKLVQNTDINDNDIYCNDIYVRLNDNGEFDYLYARGNSMLITKNIVSSLTNSLFSSASELGVTSDDDAFGKILGNTVNYHQYWGEWAKCLQDTNHIWGNDDLTLEHLRRYITIQCRSYYDRGGEVSLITNILNDFERNYQFEDNDLDCIRTYLASDKLYWVTSLNVALHNKIHGYYISDIANNGILKRVGYNINDLKEIKENKHKNDMKTLLCCICRQENKYIREFVNYYKNLGFTNICICDNNYDGEEHFEDVISDYVESGFVFIKDVRNRKNCQKQVYQECYDEYGDKYDWIAFFDTDEFLTFTKKNTIIEYLSSPIFTDANIIHINWMNYTDGGNVRYDTREVLTRFTEPCDFEYKCTYNFPEDFHIKSIIRGGLNGVDWNNSTNPHTPANKDLNCVDCSGRIVASDSPFAIINFTDAYLRHFSTKTAEEYALKMRRGFPDRDKMNVEWVVSLIENNFFHTNKVTQEKIDIFKEILGIDMQYLLPKTVVTHGEKSNDVRIYSLCYSKKDFDFLDDAVVTPLQVGAARNKENVCELKDNTGDNISFANFFYIENTGTYWIWKNVHGCKYKGQMQYRRPLSGINESTDFDKIFSEYDVITCKPFHHPDHKEPTAEEPMVIPADTVEQGYAFSNCIVDIKILETVINESFPEYKESYEKHIKNGPDLYYSNGFIMREEDYDKYCEFLFGVLNGYLDKAGISNELDLWFHVGRNLGAGAYNQRYKNPYTVPKEAIKWQTEIGGFLSERIWTLYCKHNFSKIYEVEYVKMEKGMFT